MFISFHTVVMGIFFFLMIIDFVCSLAWTLVRLCKCDVYPVFTVRQTSKEGNKTETVVSIK